MSEDALFAAAVAIANPSERAAFLDRACADDSGLRRRVAARLAGHARSDQFRLDPAESGAPGPTVVVGAPRAESDPLDGLRRYLEPPLKEGAVGRLGRYELLRVLGKGGFGVVLRAFDAVLQREVAIKVLIGDAAKNGAARERFVREARAAAPIRHENVVQVYDIHPDPVPHLVMELVPGASLQDLIDRAAPLPAASVAALGAQVARGLAAAHARGIVHRDLKPANVLVEGPDAAPRAKLTDFGLARAGDDASLTQSGMVAGTPMYMSPEQARGEPLDARSDLFSLGGVLYTMATGKPPFRGATSLAVMRQLCDFPHEPVQSAVPGAPAWLCAVIDKLLAKEAADRYQSAAEVAEALLPAPAVATAPVPPPAAPRAPTSSETFGQLGTPSATEVVPESPAPPKARQQSRVSLVVAVLAVCVSAVLAVASVASLLRSREEAKVEPEPDPQLKGKDAPPKAEPIALAPPPRRKVFAPPTGGEYVSALEMKFVRVPKGGALLGGGRKSKEQQMNIFDSELYFGAFEVTQGQYQRLTGTNPSLFSKTGKNSHLVMNVSANQLADFPVENVSCIEAKAFARRLNELSPVSGWEYRLPTPKEWEYACRGGPMQNPRDTNFDFYFDGPPTNDPGPFAKLKGVGLPRPERVGSYRPNRLGLYNMHGNVAEWCDDGPDEGPIKGGGYIDGPDIAAASVTMTATPDARPLGVGFRVVLAPVGTPKKK